MKIRQLSVFLENRIGRLAGITRILGNAGIDIIAISVADTADFGILRLLVKDIDKAAEVLAANDVVCRINNVTVVAVGSQPGGLAKVVEGLHSAGVNVEYMYAVAQTSRPHPLMVFRFTEGETAVRTLQEQGLEVLSEEDLFA